MEKQMSADEDAFVVAREADLRRAQAIAQLPIRPIGILPRSVGDPIRPFAIGLWNDIKPLLRPDPGVTQLRRATGAYLHSKAYHLATARPVSMRHDLDGNPAGEVSEANRADAKRRATTATQTGTHPSAAQPIDEPSVEESPVAATRNDMIRAGLLRRRRDP